MFSNFHHWLFYYAYRIAILQQQLLTTCDKIRYLEFQHKEYGDDNRQRLLELRNHETLIRNKIADAKQEVEDKEIDDSVSAGYTCNQCSKQFWGMLCGLCINVYDKLCSILQMYEVMSL